MKRTLCIILAVLTLFSAAVVSASAADTGMASTGAGNKIYFDCSGWKNVSIIYCHIWRRGGDAFFGWQAKKEKCTSEGGTKYSYDIDTLSQSTQLSGGLQSGEDYCIIFSANTGKQTYDCTFGKACIGDTAKLTGKLIENPVDSEKKADEAVWSKNSGSFGPHLALTSIGNIVGKFLCPNEKGIEVIGDWILTYYKNSKINHVNILTNAFPTFGIKIEADIKEIYDYIESKNTGKDEAVMKDILYKAFFGEYSGYLKKSSATLYVNKPSIIPLKNPRKTVLTFKSSDSFVAEVKEEVILPKKTGKATIEVSDGTHTEKLKITVKNPYLEKKTLTIKKGKSKKIKIIGKNNYTLFYSRNKKIAKVSSTGKIKAVKKGKVKITILTNGTSIDKTTSLETGKTVTRMENAVKLVCTVKVK